MLLTFYIVASRFLLLCRFYFNVYHIITIIILLLYFIVTFNIFILFLRRNVLIYQDCRALTFELAIGFLVHFNH